jgi:hypothetical protein
LIKIEEYYTIIVENREKLTTQIQQNIFRVTNISLTWQIEDLLSEMVVLTAEKYDTLLFKTKLKLLNYISLATCRKFVQDAEKEKTAKKKFFPALYVEDYLKHLSEEEIEANRDLDISTALLYKTIENYIEDKYGYEATGIYKTYTMNDDMSYQRLASITGCKKRDVGMIIKEIKKDLKLNKDYILRHVKSSYSF